MRVKYEQYVEYYIPSFYEIKWTSGKKEILFCMNNKCEDCIFHPECDGNSTISESEYDQTKENNPEYFI